ncbi:dihydropteroate synthase [Parasulfuritortus cantonensis]|uniref:Dihydropteroate synthase n=1 Tax=Parasulfuritortus cantonensis TaxID=2528202 RepID=A0A4R1B7X6_9PROT|nr:dihydropteroate synthase [Parasulfuritortus cantonensis]TCJ11899.1 dihydropteroate synthase [Parasulfuritortus cantonensis]
MLRCGRFLFDLRAPLVMGIVNVTPDSFSDGGRYADPERAIAHGLRLRDEGAHILDIGGESTRPGARPVTEAEERERVLPVLTALRDCGAALSVDTMKPGVMAAALVAGADLVNDVNALRAPGALEVVAGTDCGVCLMHMQGTPETMQLAPRYGDVVAEVAEFLARRVQAVGEAGIAGERLLVDPGFGFGKTRAQNVALFRAIRRFADLAPVLVGVSRKRLFGEGAGLAPGDRLAPSVAAALLAARAGAGVLRVHDVAATVAALEVLEALEPGH